MKIFEGPNSRQLTEDVANSLGVPVSKLDVQKFKDGEISVTLTESVRGQRVFIICSTPPPADNLMTLLITIDAMKRNSAAEINCVIPYFGYARKDRMDVPRTAITSKLIIDMLQAAGCHRIVTIDLHALQIQGFANIPFENIEGHAVFKNFCKRLGLKDVMLCSPDLGGVKRTKSFAKVFGTEEMAVIDKDRKEANKVSSMTLIGNVTGKNVVLVDDMIDTGGTLIKAADLLMQSGALSVRAIVTHPLLSDWAKSTMKNIEQSQLTQIITTNTVNLTPGVSPLQKISIVSCHGVLSDAIERIVHFESISEINK